MKYASIIVRSIQDSAHAGAHDGMGIYDDNTYRQDEQVAEGGAGYLR